MVEFGINEHILSSVSSFSYCIVSFFIVWSPLLISPLPLSAASLSSVSTYSSSTFSSRFGWNLPIKGITPSGLGFGAVIKKVLSKKLFSISFFSECGEGGWQLSF